MKSPDSRISPLIMVGPRGGGKTSQLIRWLNSTPFDSKLRVFVCANRLARHQVGQALERLTNGNLLGFNVITYYELLTKITKRTEWRAVDWADFFDPVFLRDFAAWLVTEVEAIVLDQCEQLKDASASLMQAIPSNISWAVAHSAPERQREKIESELPPLLAENYQWVEPVSRKESSCIEIAYSDSSDFWDSFHEWAKKTLPDSAFDENRAWSRLIVLGTDLGYAEARIKQQILFRFKTTFPDMWISGLSKSRTPPSTDFVVVREFESFSVEARAKLIIRNPDVPRRALEHEFPTLPILRGQPVTYSFIQSMSVRALNEFRLFCDGRQVVAHDISIDGPADEWWVEIIDSSTYRRVKPSQLKWDKVVNVDAREKTSPTTTVNSSVGRPTGHENDHDTRHNLMSKLQAMDQRLLNRMTAREMSKTVIRHRGRPAIVVDVNLEGPPTGWWIEILLEGGQLRVHPSELTYRR